MVNAPIVPMEGSPSPSIDVSHITSALKKKASNQSVCEALEDLKALLTAEDTSQVTEIGVAVVGHLVRVLKNPIMEVPERSLGVCRYMAASCVSSLVLAPASSKLDDRLQETHAIRLCLEFFFKYPWASCLHAPILECTSSLLCRGVDSPLLKDLLAFKPAEGFDDIGGIIQKEVTPIKP